MTDRELLERASDLAFKRLTEVNSDITRLAEPFRTVAIIYSAQGIIDNGGLPYFFENDWPHTPAYSLFADAYERIGRTAAAAAIRSAVISFNVPHPEKNDQARRSYISAHYDDETSTVRGWDDCICGDQQVWKDLAQWIRAQSDFPET